MVLWLRLGSDREILVQLSMLLRWARSLRLGRLLSLVWLGCDWVVGFLIWAGRGLGVKVWLVLWEGISVIVGRVWGVGALSYLTAGGYKGILTTWNLLEDTVA